MKYAQYITLSVVMTLIMSGCSLFPQQQESDVVAKANPASENCIDRGGQVAIRENNSGGKYGVCIFDDGSECEEWAFFHGLCKKGEQEKAEGTGTITEDTGGERMQEDRMTDKEEEEVVTEEQEAMPSGEHETAAASADLGSIRIDNISDGQQLNSPFEVTGTARVPENTLYVDVTTLSGTPLIQQSTTVRSVDATGLGTFKQKIFYEFSSTKEGYIELYGKDASGEKVEVTKIAVKF